MLLTLAMPQSKTQHSYQNKPLHNHFDHLIFGGQILLPDKSPLPSNPFHLTLYAFI